MVSPRLPTNKSAARDDHLHLSSSVRSNRIMRPGTAPPRPPVVGALDRNKTVSFRRPSFVNRNSNSGRKDDLTLELSDNLSSAMLLLSGQQALTAGELESIRLCWEALVVNKYRSTVDSKDELLALFQGLNVNFLPEVESQALRLFSSSGSRVQFDEFVQLVQRCKLLHLQHIKEHPQLCDDLVDAFVALGGQWDTKGSLDNDKMRRTIAQYDLRIDFDRFLATVDADGNAEVDFDEFKMLVEDSTAGHLRHVRDGNDTDTDNDGSPSTMLRQTSGTSFSAAAAEEVSPTLSEASSAAPHFQSGSSSPHSQPAGVKRKVLPTPLNQSDMEGTDGVVSKHASVAELGSTRLYTAAQRVPSVYYGHHSHNGTSQPSSPITTELSGQWSAPHTATKRDHHHHHHSGKHNQTPNAASAGRGTAGSAASPARYDPLAKLAHKVATAVARPSPAAGGPEGDELVPPKPLAVGTVYSELTKAITSVWDLASFRERCANTMRGADRSGNDAQPTASDHPATGNGSAGTTDQFIADVAGAVHSHKRRHKDSAFIDRISGDRSKAKECNLEERRAAIQQRKDHEVREKKLRKRRAEVKDKAVAHVISAVPGIPAPSSLNSPMESVRTRSISMGSSGNLRDMSVRSSSMRRRSAASTMAGLADPVVPEGAGNDDDDGVGSVYSTSSSQRSDDEKRVAFNFTHLMRSGRSTPNFDSMEGGEGNSMDNTAPTGAPPGAGGVQRPMPPPTTSRRRQSLQQHQAAFGFGTTAPSSPLNKTLAKIKLRERLFLLSQPTMRLGGNSNQVRLDRVRANQEQDDAAKAKARVPQVPAAKLTPHMRSRVAGLTLGEKKEICRVDEAGRERNELNAKLYECYHGRF